MFTFRAAWQDLRLAFRVLSKSPGVTAIVVLTLAIGIGANTAIYSVLDAVMLRPLAVSNPAQLWQLYDEGPASTRDSQGHTTKSELMPWPLVERFQRALPRGAAIAAMTAPTRLNVRFGLAPSTTLVESQLVSGGFFSTFGIRPAVGRLISDDDMRAVDAGAVAVISYGLWQRQFAGDPSSVGRTLRINGVPFVVVGVAPADFGGVWIDTAVDVWVPLMMQHAIGYRQNSSTNNANSEDPWPPQMRVSWLEVVLRATPESRDAIQNTFAGLHLAAMREAVGDSGDTETRRLLTRRLKMTSFARGYSDARFQYSTALWLLMGMVVLLLLVACANVANLLLARWTARQRDIAIRMSIGAARTRVIRELCAQTVLLALAGAAVSLPAAEWVITALAGSAQVHAVLPTAVTLDGRVLVFCALISVAATILVGMLPAIRATAATPADLLRGSSTSGRTTSISAMRPIVAAQVALAVVLVCGAVLLGRSLVNLSHVDPGYDRDHLVRILMDPLAGGVPQDELTALYQRVTERARHVPGVVGAEISRIGIASGRRSIGAIKVEGYEPAAGEVVRFMFNSVGPTYFATTGMPLVRGRGFTDRDDATHPKVAVVNEAAAQRYFGGIDRAVGRRVGFGPLDIQVVGVVRDARVLTLRDAPTPMAFAPILQQGPGMYAGYAQSLDVRVAGDPAQIGEAVRRAVSTTEPRLLADARPVVVADALSRGLSRDRLVAMLAAAFGGLALLLASLGLYGVLSYAVGRRTKELGVRIAIGATASDVLRLVMGEGLRLMTVGVLAGVLIAITGSRFVGSLLFGLSPSDPATYLAVAVALATVTVLAALLPARRATRVDPAVALRTE